MYLLVFYKNVFPCEIMPHFCNLNLYCTLLSEGEGDGEDEGEGEDYVSAEVEYLARAQLQHTSRG